MGSVVAIYIERVATCNEIENTGGPWWSCLECGALGAMRANEGEKVGMDPGFCRFRGNELQV